MQVNPDVSQLTLELKLGETIEIDGGRIVLTLEHKHGQAARLAFVAARSIPIRLEKNKGARQEGMGIRQA